MIDLGYRQFSSRPAKLVAILFLLMALNCLLQGYFQRGAVGDAAMIGLYLLYWPASALVGFLLNPVVDFIYQNYNHPGGVYFIFEATNALVVGTLWNYFFVKTLHWSIACARSSSQESDDDETEVDGQ